LAEHTADHLAFYRRGRCANPDNGDDWLTISPDNFDAPEMHCKVLVARANKRGDYLAKFWCDEDLIQNYWFSLFNDRLYVSLSHDHVHQRTTRRQIFIAERSRARKSQLLWSVMTQAPIAGPVCCITVANALSKSRSLPALATLGLTPNTCAAD
jgi:hypothetical protein